MSEVSRAPIVCGIDWLELAGGIDWEAAREGLFEKLNEVRRLAQAERSPGLLELDCGTVAVHGSGAGSGRDSHKEYRLDYRGATIAFSARKHRDRRLHNFAFTVPGDPCLVVGVESAWDLAWAVVAEFGGRIIDEWVRRLDVAADLPGVSIQDELVPAIQENRFLTTAKDWHLHNGSDGPTGFTFGKAPRLRVVVYNKRLEVQKRSPLYRQAMIDRRWGGSLPEAATRVEWQVGREWFDAFGIDGASQALGELPAIAARLTVERPYPFLRLTASVPDRDNRHQSRAETLPIWDRICRALRDWSGETSVKLQRVRREAIDASRHYQMVRGCLTSFAVFRGELCEGIEDAHRLLDEMHRANGGTDEEWYERWRKKARAAGVWDDLFRFPPKDVA